MRYISLENIELPAVLLFIFDVIVTSIRNVLFINIHEYNNEINLIYINHMFENSNAIKSSLDNLESTYPPQKIKAHYSQ